MWSCDGVLLLVEKTEAIEQILWKLFPIATVGGFVGAMVEVHY